MKGRKYTVSAYSYWSVACVNAVSIAGLLCASVLSVMDVNTLRYELRAGREENFRALAHDKVLLFVAVGPVVLPISRHLVMRKSRRTNSNNLRKSCC